MEQRDNVGDNCPTRHLIPPIKPILKEIGSIIWVIGKKTSITCPTKTITGKFSTICDNPHHNALTLVAKALISYVTKQGQIELLPKY